MKPASLKTALIIGASSGIGQAIAIELGKQHCWNLILIGRRQEELDATKKTIIDNWKPFTPDTNTPYVTLKSFDISQKDNRDTLLGFLETQKVSIDLLVNNAGFCLLEPFTKNDMDLIEQMIQLHCIAPMHFCHALLPAMVKRRSGQIINVCSRLALAPMPMASCYAASKTFLLNFSIALAHEMKPNGVKIIALCPGGTNTPGRLNHTASTDRSILKSHQSHEVACAALNSLEGKSPVYVVGGLNRIVFGILRLLPLTLSAKILYWRALQTYKSYQAEKRRNDAIG